MRPNGILAAAGATLLIAAAPAAADTYTVTSTADTAGLCSATAPNCPSIREAINGAIQHAGPDTVVIPGIQRGNAVEVVAEKTARAGTQEAAKEALGRIEIVETASPFATQLPL